MSKAREELLILTDETPCTCEHERWPGQAQCPKVIQQTRYACSHRLENGENAHLPAKLPDEFAPDRSTQAGRDYWILREKYEGETHEETTPYHELIDELVSAGKLEEERAVEFKEYATALHVKLREYDGWSSSLGKPSDKDVSTELAELEKEQAVTIGQLKNLKHYLLAL